MLSVLGLIVLAYLAGAAAMFFKWPTSGYLTRAFLGSQDWSAQGPPPGAVPVPHGVGKVVLTTDRKDLTDDGYLLSVVTNEAGATLRDMEGKVVHKWQMPSKVNWPANPDVRMPSAVESIHWEACQVWPNGDLIALCAPHKSPYGFGVIKLDRNSQLLWAYTGNVHHGFDVGEDGRVYVLTNHFETGEPPGFPVTLTRYIAEGLVILSPEGQEVQRISLEQAFHDSHFSMAFVSQLMRNSNHSWTVGDQGSKTKASSPDDVLPGDIFHTNSVKVLPQAPASRFPLFKPGWLLLSFRSSSLLAVLDPQKQQVVWAASGPWQAQHDAQFLADGHLLLFDNFGSQFGSRVLEYDPVSQGVLWAYASEDVQPVRVGSRGACQRLANGNTLIVVPDRSVFEVTSGRETVWELSLPDVISARRFSREELLFLPTGSTPRSK